MLKILDLFVVPLAAAVFLPSAVLFIEVIASLAPRRPMLPPAQQLRARILVLIPAHNEELAIGQTVAGVKAQLTAADTLLVIADNCSDSTAKVARDAGATVIERADLSTRGKGYAIAYAMEKVKGGEIQGQHAGVADVFVLLDADCQIGPGTLDALAAGVVATSQPVQAGYRLAAPATADPRAVLSTFAFALKNILRPAGLANLGVSIPLTGSGMAFPFELAASLHWATGHIAEDMKLGAELADRNIRVRPAPGARVTSAQPTDAKVALTQRTRWEHGHLKVILEQALPLLFKSVLRLRPRQAFAALDLMIPPLALLAALWLGSAVIVAIAFPITRHGLAPILSGITLLMLLVALAVAWWKEGRQSGISLARLLSIPFYILWKLPLYFRFLTGKRQQAWVRTERDANEVGQNR